MRGLCIHTVHILYLLYDRRFVRILYNIYIYVSYTKIMELESNSHCRSEIYSLKLWLERYIFVFTHCIALFVRCSFMSTEY